MSKISLKPNASGTGVFSLEAPNSNVDRTLNLPDEAGTLATVENLPAGYTDSDALDLFNATGSAPVYACRAWVNFDGTNTTIRDSGNVSSITDNGTGDYTVNFATAMPDNNYTLTSGVLACRNGSVNEDRGGTFVGYKASNSSSVAGGTVDAGSVRVQATRGSSSGGNGNVTDVDIFSIAVFR